MTKLQQNLWRHYSNSSSIGAEIIKFRGVR